VCKLLRLWDKLAVSKCAEGFRQERSARFENGTLS
jgi:hypothetical protein